MTIKNVVAKWAKALTQIKVEVHEGARFESLSGYQYAYGRINFIYMVANAT